MYYTYVLRSKKDDKWYIGSAEDVNRRVAQHNAGTVQSTKSRAPFDLIYHESFSTRSEARWQERKWKTTWGHKKLKELLKNIPW